MTDFGEILAAIGDFGLFQKLLLLGLCLPNYLLPMTFASLLFLQSDPGRCNTDWILTAAPNLSSEEQLNLTLPLDQDGTFSRCLMFVPVDWDIDAIRQYGLNETTACQGGWVYDKSQYDATIVTDFDLVCDKSNLVGVAQTVFLAGVLCGSLIFGPAAESCGRRRGTQIPVVLLLIFTLTAGLSPNLYVYMVSQFIVGAALGGYRINATVLGTEWIGITKRSLSSCLNQMFGGVGQCVIAGLVYGVRDWRTAQHIMAGLQAVVFIYIWFIPESARWLLGRGRNKEANEVIMRAAAINKHKVPENLLVQVTQEQKIQTGGIKALFTKAILVKYFFIITFAWFSLNLGYFCLSLNVGKFGLDIFLVQLMFGVTEIPAHLLCFWLLEVVGRKISLAATLLMGGVICLITLALPQDSAIAITVLATIGRFFMNWAGSVCMVYSQELFPTSIRQTAVGLSSICYRIGALLAPLLNLLAVFHWSIPTVVFSSLTVASGVLSLLLPETKSIELPDSTDEALGDRNMTAAKRRGNSKGPDIISIMSTKF